MFNSRHRRKILNIHIRVINTSKEKKKVPRAASATKEQTRIFAGPFLHIAMFMVYVIRGKITFNLKNNYYLQWYIRSSMWRSWLKLCNLGLNCFCLNWSSANYYVKLG